MKLVVAITRRQYVSPLPPAMEPGEFYLPFPLEVERAERL